MEVWSSSVSTNVVIRGLAQYYDAIRPASINLVVNDLQISTVREREIKWSLGIEVLYWSLAVKSSRKVWSPWNMAMVPPNKFAISFGRALGFEELRTGKHTSTGQVGPKQWH